MSISSDNELTRTNFTICVKICWNVEFSKMNQLLLLSSQIDIIFLENITQGLETLHAEPPDSKPINKILNHHNNSFQNYFIIWWICRAIPYGFIRIRNMQSKQWNWWQSVNVIFQYKQIYGFCVSCFSKILQK